MCPSKYEQLHSFVLIKFPVLTAISHGDIMGGSQENVEDLMLNSLNMMNTKICNTAFFKRHTFEELTSIEPDRSPTRSSVLLLLCFLSIHHSRIGP